jgi:hypothetical protein
VYTQYPVRLPDLPTAGTSTKREQQLTDAVMFFLRGAERERELLLMYVIEGPEVFIPRIMKAFKAWRIDEDLARAVYGYLKLLAGYDPQGQLANLLKIRPKMGVPS